MNEDLSRLSEAAFIVGLPRSGTTLVSMMLNASSEIIVPPETHYFHYFWNAVERHGAEVPGVFPDVASAYLASYLGPTFGLSAQERAELLRVAEEKRNHRDFLARIMSLYAQKHGVRKWAEKTPGHVRYLRVLARMYPGARVLHVVRDPRDVYLSQKHLDWGTKNPVIFAQDWQRQVRTRSSDLPCEYMEVKYERLLMEPEHSLRAIADFLGIPYSPMMLEFHKHAHWNFDLTSEPWKKKTAVALDSTNFGKWKTHLPGNEARAIQHVAGETMRALGYLCDPERSSWRAALVTARFRLSARRRTWRRTLRKKARKAINQMRPVAIGGRQAVRTK